MIDLQSRAEEFIYDYFSSQYLIPSSQFKIGPFSADFAWPEARVVLEYDGIVHIDQVEKDIKRTEYIKSQGWNIFNIKAMPQVSKWNDKYSVVFNGERQYSASKLTPELEKIRDYVLEQTKVQGQLKERDRMDNRRVELNKQLAIRQKMELPLEERVKNKVWEDRNKGYSPKYKNFKDAKTAGVF